jgi:histidinol-phosphatase (PHP family)
MQEYVQTAVSKRLKRIVFLEHMEEGISAPQPSWLSESDFDYYFDEGKRLQEKYQGVIEIGLGVECGYNSEYKDTLKRRLNKRKWDQIGISCHFLKIEPDQYHLNLLSKKPENVTRAVELDTDILFSRYLNTLLEAVTELPGSILCHLDAAFRWVPGHRLSEHHYQEIEILLKKATAKGMALEINTSGINIREEPFPNSRILDLAIQHKMPLRLGSDAHRPDDVGSHFNLFS